jgi:hypothetical protein
MLQIGQRTGAGEVKLQRTEPKAHDMAVGVDQAGEQCFAACINPRCGRGARLALCQQLHHLAVVADMHAGEALELALRVDLDAVRIVDQRIGQRRGGKDQRGDQQCKTLHGSYLLRREDVSRRPPLSA